MLKPRQRLQPRYYEAFHCIADACPDTCCEGWRVGVDRSTYEKYQRCSHPTLAAPLQKFITINPARTGDDNYATITTAGARCPLLSDGLCSVHRQLGEENLGNTCASYPRISNVVDGVLERSLDLSCPEAARLALIDPEPLNFHLVDHENAGAYADARLANVAVLNTRESPEHKYAPQIRKLVLSVLQDRRHSVAKRLLLLGHFCDGLNKIDCERAYDKTQELLEGFPFAVDAGLFDAHLNGYAARPVTQLEVVLELVVARIGSDYTPQRFFDLYRDFMQGIGWREDSSMDEIGARYTHAYSEYYAPFMNTHEYMLENYLVNNAYKNVFPFGSPTVKKALGMVAMENAIAAQYMLLTCYFAIIKTMLIGLAGFHKSAFSPEHVIRAIQSCSKTFEHSTTFPARILELLAARGIRNSAGMAVLTQN